MDPTEQIRILGEAQGSTALLTLATIDLVYGKLSEADRARSKAALVAAAVPHWCDTEMLATLLQATHAESDALLAHLRKLAVIEVFPARGESAINVHEATRLALREYLRTNDRARWKLLSQRARECVVRSKEPYARIEALYHLFAIDHAEAFREFKVLNQEFTDSARSDARYALAFSLKELTDAGMVGDLAEVKELYSSLGIAVHDRASLRSGRRAAKRLTGMSGNPKRFRVAFSFSSEKRKYVAAVAAILARRFGKEAILYDEFHEEEFAESDSAIYLPRLYREESVLVVPIFSPAYTVKPWTGWEWKDIIPHLTRPGALRVMPCRFEHVLVGEAPIAGFLDLDLKSPKELAGLIVDRVASIEGPPPPPEAEPEDAVGRIFIICILLIGFLAIVCWFLNNN